PIKARLARLLQRTLAGRRSRGAGPALAQAAAFDRDEAGAEALHARIVLVARGLVDDALAAELGLEGLHGKAVRLRAAVAAAFAHHLVDHRAHGRIGELVALAAAALLGGARLVVDERRDARRVAQLALHAVELVAVANRDAFGPARALRVLARLVGHDNDGLHALGRELARDHGRVERPVVALAARHGHRVVVEDLVGHVDLRRDGGADGEQAGVEVGAVAEVREDVLLFGEGRLADPRRALRTHVREGGGVPVHPDGHEVAADAGGGAAAFGNAGRSVVRAAGAEVGLPDRGDARLRQRLFLELEEREALLELAAQAFGHPEPLQARGDDLRHHRGRVLVVGREEPVAGRLAAASAPLAVVVELAHH